MTPRDPSSRTEPRVPSLAAALALAFTPAAMAQSAPPALQETVVTATRVEQPLAELVADVSVIDRETIETSGATGVADLLARLPGVELSRNGGIGNSTSLFLRGGEVTLDTPHGPQDIRIDRNVPHGASLCLSGKGLPATEAAPAGNLYIRLEACPDAVRPVVHVLSEFRQRWAS